LRCILSDAVLIKVDMSTADARQANFAGANLEGATLTGAKLFGVLAPRAKTDDLIAEWIDASPTGNDTKRLTGADIRALLDGKLLAAPSAVRYFGEGDVLRDATLEFGDGSSVEIESRFEKCTIALGNGTELVVGEAGVLKDCVIRGAGNITIHGAFFERESPGIVGPRTLIVSSMGSLVGAVEQALEPTQFAFEPGCRLRVKILRART
jgi:uncharacterized protein YjbI with pentapeptide repeats